MIARLISTLALPLILLLAFTFFPAHRHPYNPIIPADPPPEESQVTVVPYVDFLGDGGLHWVQQNLEQESPADRTVREQLAKKLVDVMLVHQCFEKAIDYFRDATNINIFVNWTALEQIGIDRNTPITLELRNVTTSQALHALLVSLPLPPPPAQPTTINFLIDDGVLTISTTDDLESPKYQIIRVYDLRPLLQNSESQNQQLAPKIIQSIQQTIAPQSWRDKGGQIGSIRELNGQLIINQTLNNQRAISKLFKQLPETQNLPPTDTPRSITK